MSSSLVLPLLEQLIPGGIGYNTNLLVEFPSDSLWYEASLTITAQALREGVQTEYHVFQHPPTDVRNVLAGFGFDIRKLEDTDVLRVLDSYTVQTGVVNPEEDPARTARQFVSQSLKVSDWSISGMKAVKTGAFETKKHGLHIDDNTLVLVRYNSEPAIIDFWRTRAIASSRLEESLAMYSMLTGVASESFRSQFESLHDGIIDFKTEENGGEIEQYVRVRILRGKRINTRWRRISLLDNGEVTLGD